VISPPGNRDATIDRLPAGLPLLPGSVDSNSRVTRNVGSYLGEGGNWVVEHKEWGDRLSCAEYLRRENIKIQGDMEIVGRVKSRCLHLAHMTYILNPVQNPSRKLGPSQ
jgi:hypothetical protein